MNTIFNGRAEVAGVTYDYSGVWTRSSQATAWKAIVRNADVVCRSSGSIEADLNDTDTNEVIRELVKLDILDALERSTAGIAAR